VLVVHDPPDPPLVEPEVPLDELLPDPPLVDPEVLWARACPRKSTETKTTEPNLEPLLKVLSFLPPQISTWSMPGRAWQKPETHQAGRAHLVACRLECHNLGKQSLCRHDLLPGTAGNSMRASAVVVFHNSLRSTANRRTW
jgi:hypothetical protein